MKAMLWAAAATTIIGISACTKEKVELTSDEQKFSYAVGFQMGQNLKHQNLDLDTAALSQAIKDVLADKEPQVTKEEMQAAIQVFQQKKMKEREDLAITNKEAGEKFLEENKKKADVKVLPSGVQYKVIEEGTGRKPKPTDMVVVHYRGTLIDGTEFDSSYKRQEPATFAVNGVIKGWQEIIPMMKEGAKWHVAIPADMAYGPRGAGGLIGPNATLVFEINLLGIKGEPQSDAKKNNMK
ncbi:MAG: FKBP-type peptidyl-prolyl cis-trans isomerase [Gammaproteobacteria bacterium]|nr:FKBP-type peptidyl-prolyl cis-trans isomerase [Gammaproteobacteria bacterium]